MQVRDNCAQERRHNLRRIVLVLELEPMITLGASVRLPETVQERVETLQMTWGGAEDGVTRLERYKGLWRRFWPLSLSVAQG